tara:strand:- start:530 stop:1039 length:510 start_codon:yes stop_codon:yes gene_type:complete
MDQCPICLNENIKEEEKCLTECSHIYCKNCLDSYFNRGNNTCPLCRRDIYYYHMNNINYRIILKTIQNNDNDRDFIIRNLLRINRGLRNIFFISFFSLTCMSLLYIHLNDNYSELKNDYELCQLNNTQLVGLNRRLNHDLNYKIDASILYNGAVYNCLVSYIDYVNCFK